jgi:Uma2 family endonuclease
VIAVPAITFESVQTLTQGQFAAWLRAREGLWDPNGYELIEGRIVMNPPAGYPHGRIESRVSKIISMFVDDNRSGVVFGSSQGFELPTGDTVEPDISFVSSERLAAGPAPREGEFLRVVPDLVVEIISRSTATRDRKEKKRIYERAGVREYWMVDFAKREIVLLVRKGKTFGKARTCSRRLVSVVLAGLEIEVHDVFPRAPPSL